MARVQAQNYCIVHPDSELDSRKFSFTDSSIEIEASPVTPHGRERFFFDRVLAPKTPQEKVFEEVAKSAVVGALDFFVSAAFIAFGTTGGGKTFTVTGGAKRFADRGLIPRSISALFEALAAREDREDFEVTVSFYEIYKDAVVDLLSERRKRVSVQTEAEGPVLLGLRKQAAAMESDAYHLLFHGDSNRHFDRFPLNEETSRGHVFYELHLTHLPSRREATLSFIDLAATISARNQATASITRSLDALRCCISALNNGDHPPYESSILTQLLKPWLQPHPGSMPVSLVILSPIKYMEQMHEEHVEWLHFSQLVRRALGSTSKIDSQGYAVDAPYYEANGYDPARPQANGYDPARPQANGYDPVKPQAMPYGSSPSASPALAPEQAPQTCNGQGYLGNVPNSWTTSPEQAFQTCSGQGYLGNVPNTLTTSPEQACRMSLGHMEAQAHPMSAVSSEQSFVQASGPWAPPHDQRIARRVDEAEMRSADVGRPPDFADGLLPPQTIPMTSYPSNQVVVPAPASSMPDTAEPQPCVATVETLEAHTKTAPAAHLPFQQVGYDLTPGRFVGMPPMTHETQEVIFGTSSARQTEEAPYADESDQHPSGKREEGVQPPSACEGPSAGWGTSFTAPSVAQPAPCHINATVNPTVPRPPPASYGGHSLTVPPPGGGALSPPVPMKIGPPGTFAPPVVPMQNCASALRPQGPDMTVVAAYGRPIRPQDPPEVPVTIQCQGSSIEAFAAGAAGALPSAVSSTGAGSMASTAVVANDNTGQVLGAPPPMGMPASSAAAPTRCPIPAGEAGTGIPSCGARAGSGEGGYYGYVSSLRASSQTACHGAHLGNAIPAQGVRMDNSSQFDVPSVHHQNMTDTANEVVSEAGHPCRGFSFFNASGSQCRNTGAHQIQGNSVSSNAPAPPGASSQFMHNSTPLRSRPTYCQSQASTQPEGPQFAARSSPRQPQGLVLRPGAGSTNNSRSSSLEAPILPQRSNVYAQPNRQCLGSGSGPNGNCIRPVSNDWSSCQSAVGGSTGPSTSSGGPTTRPLSRERVTSSASTAGLLRASAVSPSGLDPLQSSRVRRSLSPSSEPQSAGGMQGMQTGIPPWAINRGAQAAHSRTPSPQPSCNSSAQRFDRSQQLGKHAPPRSLSPQGHGSMPVGRSVSPHRGQNAVSQDGSSAVAPSAWPLGGPYHQRGSFGKGHPQRSLSPMRGQGSVELQAGNQCPRPLSPLRGQGSAEPHTRSASPQPQGASSSGRQLGGPPRSLSPLPHGRGPAQDTMQQVPQCAYGSMMYSPSGGSQPGSHVPAPGNVGEPASGLSRVPMPITSSSGASGRSPTPLGFSAQSVQLDRPTTPFGHIPGRGGLMIR